MKARRMCRIALITALLCVVGPMTIPVGPVPVSMATLGVYLAGALLGKYGTMAAALYILIGAVGLPVFSGFGAGAQHIAGPTGGFIAGYLPCAAAVGFAAQRGKKSGLLTASMILGTVMCYVAGTAWFTIQTGVNISGAIVSCVIPFLPGDAMKIVAATVIVRRMKRWMVS